MKIVVFGNEDSWNELTVANNDVEWSRAENINSFFNEPGADAFFYLSGDAPMHDYSNIQKPVFINSVTKTLQEINAGKNVVRINGWNGFLKRSSWEVAGNVSASHISIIDLLKKKHIVVPDEAGFISARIIAMIINEAFFAKGENVSTENEINIAMKLGTNYPLGPFEWANAIGLKYVYELLLILCKTDPRYNPAPSMTEKVKYQ